MTTSLVMQRRVFSRVGRKKSKKMIDYLKSDNYMFAPLISSLPPDASVQMKPGSAAGTGVESEKPMKRKRTKLMKEVLEHPKSDTFMYGYLMVPHSSDGVLGTKIRSPCTTGSKGE